MERVGQSAGLRAASSPYRCRRRRLVALSCKAILLSAKAANAILSTWITEKPPALVWHSWPRFEPQNGHVKVIGFIGSGSGIETEILAMERMVAHPFQDEQLKQTFPAGFVNLGWQPDEIALPLANIIILM